MSLFNSGIDFSTDFQYVVERKEQEKICFLSGTERKFIFKEDLNTSDYDLKSTSALYKILNKVRSNKGVGGLADLAPRFPKERLEQIPGPTQYNVGKEYKFKPSRNGFGSTCRILPITSKTPGPGSYGPTTKGRKLVMNEAFGGNRKIKPCVDVYCSPTPADVCMFCKTICIGDYWHRNLTDFICLPCMRLEKRKYSKFNRAELLEFRKIRSCAFMHKHDGTTAAIHLMKKKDICVKFRKENYLDLYLNKYY